MSTVAIRKKNAGTASDAGNSRKADTVEEQADRTAAASARTPHRRPLIRMLLGGLGGVIVLALLVAVVVLGSMYWQDRQAEQAGPDAVAAASHQAVAMLGYDFDNVESELPKAADGLTGDFKQEYATLIQQAIIPGAKEKQLTVKATVQGAAVVSASRDEATVLLFLNQLTTSKDTPEAVTTGSRIRVELHHDDGRWLVSQLTPI